MLDSLLVVQKEVLGKKINKAFWWKYLSGSTTFLLMYHVHTDIVTLKCDIKLRPLDRLGSFVSTERRKNIQLLSRYHKEVESEKKLQFSQYQYFLSVWDKDIWHDGLKESIFFISSITLYVIVLRMAESS